MAYTNVPPSMQDIHALINDRLSKAENAGRFTAPVLQNPFSSTPISTWLKSRPQTGDVFVDQETDTGYEYWTSLVYQKPVTYPSGYIADVISPSDAAATFNITAAEGLWNFKTGTVFTVSGATVTSFSTYAEKEFYNTIWVVTSGANIFAANLIDAVKIADQPPLATIPTYTPSSGVYTIISEPAWLEEKFQKTIYTTNLVIDVYPNQPVFVYRPSANLTVRINAGRSGTDTFTVYVESGAIARWVSNIIAGSAVDLWSPAAPTSGTAYKTRGYHFQTTYAVDTATNTEYPRVFVTWENYA